MYFVGVFFPTQWSALIVAVPIFLPAIEVTGWVATIFVIIGLFLFLARRISSPLLRVVTTKMDWLLLIVLILQVGLGFWIATIHYPGASWYVSSIVPWLQSLVTLSPNPALVAGTPPEVQMHMLTALFLMAILPFTRLVHSLSVTIVSYLWRPYQVVVWVTRKRSSDQKKAEEKSR
jgi:nitrate reductase gamma subunit